MKTYTFSFQGRERGAIGVFCNYFETVTAENEEEAKLKLYDKYDHIHFCKAVEIDKSEGKDERL